MQQHSAAAVDAVEDPLYRLASTLPWVGDDLTAVSTVAHSVDNLASQIGPGLLDAIAVLDPNQLMPTEGGVDLEPLITAASRLHTADTLVGQDLADLHQLGSESLAGPVSDAVEDLTAKLTKVQQVTAKGSEITGLLPQLLGSDGPRRYLVVFQNLAELRSTGGIFGSYAVLTIDHGQLTVSGQGASSRTIGFLPAPVVEESADQLALYGPNIATIPMDVNFTPDFPYSARSFAAMYQQQIDPTPLDGVISVDPVALADMLHGFEPVSFDGIALNSSNLTAMLLSDAYAMFPDDDKDQTQRDAFLAGATAAAFQTMTTHPRDVGAVSDGLLDGLEQRRILLYSFDPTEQATLSGLGVTGELPATDAATSPTFGVFLNDRTDHGSKLGYYQSGAATVTAGSCTADGSREVTVELTLHYDAPASGLPLEVRGADPNAYVLRTEIRSYAPTGAALTAVQINGTAVDVTTGTDLDRAAAKFTTDQHPGAITTVTLALSAAGRLRRRRDAEPAADTRRASVVGDRSGVHRLRLGARARADRLQQEQRAPAGPQASLSRRARRDPPRSYAPRDP